MRRLLMLYLAAALFLNGPPVVKAEEAAAPKRVRAKWTDLAGKKHAESEFTTARATAFFFTSTQCPISNLYINRIAEIARDYVSRGVRCYLVNSNRDDSAEAFRKYVRERKLELPVVKDSGTYLADRLGASMTPEAVVLDSKGVVRYRGRIDDSTERERVTHRNVRDALDALLAGRPVRVARTLTPGCAIFRHVSGRAAAPAASPGITYAGQVAGILNSKCVACHRRGEVAPFALENYRQARTWAAQIKDYTTRRIMPPWKPSAGWGDFHDQRGLTPDQIETLARWADAGSPPGNLKKAPAPPVFPNPAAWQIGKPDLVLSPDREYHLEAEGRDVYRNFVLKHEFTEDTYLRGMEFKPGNRAIVHHVVAYIDPTRASESLDGKDKEPGYSVPGTGPGFNPAIWGDVWVPGSSPRLLPTGIGIKIPKGARLVVQVHYHKTGKPEHDRTQVALYRSKSMPDKTMHTLAPGQIFFTLKPGDPHSPVNGSLILPADVTLFSIFPHMHMLGKSMKVTATLPNGTERRLIWIEDWDFNWQATYFFRDPIRLPRGTRIDVRAVFDNSDSNPRQHTLPPRKVTFGPQTTDEMMFCFLGVTVDSGDLRSLPGIFSAGG